MRVEIQIEAARCFHVLGTKKKLRQNQAGGRSCF
jgi:hypothetical protein